MKSNVIIVGAGNSGRGMLGEMFYTDGQYNIIFADIDSKLIEGLKKQGYYKVKMTNLASKESKITKVDKYGCIDVISDHDLFIQKMTKTNLICTALKASGFDLAIDNFIEMIRLRIKENIKDKVYIILGANYVGLKEYYDKKIRRKLNAEEINYYEQYITLVLSIINRKNLKPLDVSSMEPYSIVGDDKPVLKVERNEICDLKPMPTFFKLEDKLDSAMAIKIWSGNVIQCSMAFVALSKGMRNTFEAVNDEFCHEMAYRAAVEAIYGVNKEYGIEGDVEEKALNGVDIFKNPKFFDDLYRIGQQPIRKIAYNDRFIGPARLAIKHGKLPEYIAKCLSYVFIMDLPEDQELIELKESLKSIGIRETIIKYCGLNENVEDEKVIINLICDSYKQLEKEQNC